MNSRPERSRQPALIGRLEDHRRAERRGPAALVLSLVVSVLVAGLSGAAGAEVIDLKTGDNSIRLLVEIPANPAHVAVLLAGGHGKVVIKDDGEITKLKTNFAVRSRTYLLQSGVVTAVLGPPSDLKSSPDGLKGRRTSSSYAAHLRTVVAYLKKRFQLPVWLHGTSRGTIGAAHAAIELRGSPEAPDGIILSAGVLSDNHFRDHLLNMNLDKIDIPVLVQHHRKDSCEMTSPDNVPKVIDGLTKAPVKKAILYAAGSNPSGKECESMHYHGFIGTEQLVADDMSKFIKQNSR